MKSYDLIVVSSSPAMVLEALKYKKMGLHVGVFDDRERIGGAWYVKDLFGYKNVEVGCHFIYNNDNVYDFLNQIDTSDLEVMNPQPSFVISGIKNKALVPSDHFANLKFVIKRILFKDRTYSCRQMQIISGIRETFTEKNPKRFLQGIISFFQYTPYKYFTKGCGEFMEKIQELVTREQLEMNFNVRIRDVDIEPGIGGQVVVGGETIKFKKLLLSKHVKFDSLNIHEKVVYERKEWRKKHFVFCIKGKFTKEFSYVDLVNDPVLKRVSDVGRYCTGLDAEHVLICSDTTEEIDANHSNDEIKDLIFERLIELDFLQEDATLEDSFVEKFISDYTPKDKIKELFEESKGVIVSIDTSDLGKSIDMYRDSWQSIIEN